MEKKYVIALDQGTTSSRAVIFDREQHIINISQREYTQRYPKEGWVEHDPLEIYASQYGVLIDGLLLTGISPEEVAAIGITMGQIRLSSGLENTQDLLDDFEQALDKL